MSMRLGGVALWVAPLFFMGCDVGWLEGTVSENIAEGPHTLADYEVNVYIPPGYEEDASGLPLVLVLDGDMGFSGVAELAEDAAESGLAQPAVLLGVGNEDWRGLDMTPTPVGSEPSGGIEAYFDWIETELVPAVEAETGCGGSPDLRVVTGHSYGGLATTWAMLERHDFWGAFGASSASLWWDDGYMFSAEAAYAEQYDELPARAYFSMGAIEVAPMNIDFNNFVDIIEARSYEGLSFESEVLYGHEHYSSFDPAFVRTLEVLIPAGGAE